MNYFVSWVDGHTESKHMVCVGGEGLPGQGCRGRAPDIPPTSLPVQQVAEASKQQHSTLEPRRKAAFLLPLTKFKSCSFQGEILEKYSPLQQSKIRKGEFELEVS